jgi:hypothetical protein
LSDQVRINGNAVSWGSIKLKAADEIFSGFNSVSWEHKRTRTYLYGMAQAQTPRARSRGKYEPGAVKLGGPKDSILALKKRLAQLSPNGKNYGDVVFQIIVEFVEEGNESQLVRIEDCVIVGVTSSHEESADPLKDELEISCMRIVENSMTLFTSQ